MTVSQKAKSAQQARSKARERRLQRLDADRAARDARIEAAAAEVFLGVKAREAALRAVTEGKRDVGAAEDGIGEALRRLLAERVDIEQAADLCELSVAEARRLRRRKPAVDAVAEGDVAGEPAAG